MNIGSGSQFFRTTLDPERTLAVPTGRRDCQRSSQPWEAAALAQGRSGDGAHCSGGWAGNLGGGGLAGRKVGAMTATFRARLSRWRALRRAAKGAEVELTEGRGWREQDFRLSGPAASVISL